MGDEDPGDSTGEGCLEVPCKPTAPAEPGECAFDDPAPRQNLEAFGPIRALDDFECPSPEFGQVHAQFVPGIGAIGKDMAQPGVEPTDRGEDIDGAVAVLDIGAMNLQADEMSLGVGDDVALAALDLFPCVIAAWAPAF